MPGSSLAQARELSPVFPVDAMADELHFTTGPQWIFIHDRDRQLRPPRRDGTFGTIVIQDSGIKVWCGANGGRAHVRINGYFDATNYEPQVPLDGHVGEMTVPSGVLRVTATKEDTYSDITTRKATVAIRVVPGMPDELEVVVKRHERGFVSPKRIWTDSPRAPRTIG